VEVHAETRQTLPSVRNEASSVRALLSGGLCELAYYLFTDGKAAREAHPTFPGGVVSTSSSSSSTPNSSSSSSSSTQNSSRGSRRSSNAVGPKYRTPKTQDLRWSVAAVVSRMLCATRENQGVSSISDPQSGSVRGYPVAR
ncbi:unnamed protein product, partial [Ectocarpus fasciculatus]